MSATAKTPMLLLFRFSMRPAGVLLFLATVLTAAATLTPPSIILQPASQTNTSGARVVLEILVSGTGPFRYQWAHNGAPLPNNIITTVVGNGTAGLLRRRGRGVERISGRSQRCHL